jgi:hypothetical protein
VRHGADILAELHASDVLRDLSALEPDPKLCVSAHQIDDIAALRVNLP